jgi:hypothetical protein
MSKLPEEKTMKKVAIVLTLACLALGSIGTAGAGTKCYNWSPYVDVLKVTVTTQDSHSPSNKLLTGALYVPGYYYLTFIGTQLKDADGSSKRFSIHLTNNTDAFGGYRECALDATLLTNHPAEGPLTIDCGAGGFTNTGTLVQVSCSTLPSPSALRALPPGARMGGE